MEVRERVDIVASTFKRDVQKPVLLRYDPDQKPVIIVTLESPGRSVPELREIADRLVKKQIEGVPGVSEIFVIGGRVREIMFPATRKSSPPTGSPCRRYLDACNCQM